MEKTEKKKKKNTKIISPTKQTNPGGRGERNGEIGITDNLQKVRTQAEACSGGEMHRKKEREMETMQRKGKEKTRMRAKNKRHEIEQLRCQQRM